MRKFQKKLEKKFCFCVNLFQENKQNFPKLAKFSIFLAKQVKVKFREKSYNFHSFCFTNEMRNVKFLAKRFPHIAGNLNSE